MGSDNTLLVCLHLLVYRKMGYSANIIQIEKTFDVSHATAGIVSTCFFFAYGAGQIINGIFCKKYNVKYVIFFSLLVSGVCNLLMGVLQTFIYQKYIWFINGATLSVLCPSLIRYLSERLKKEEMSSAVPRLDFRCRSNANDGNKLPRTYPDEFPPKKRTHMF